MTGSVNGQPRYDTYRAIYKSNPWCYAAVNAIARGLARMAINTFALDESGHPHRVRHDLPGRVGRPTSAESLDRLLDYPEPGVGAGEWVTKVAIDWLVLGNGIAVCDRESTGPSGVPSALWHTPFRKVEVLEGEQVPILGYKVTGTKDSRAYAVDEVIHWGRGTDPDNPRLGMSPLEPLSATVRLHDALWRHLNAYFENAMRPSGVLSVKPGTSDKALKSIREQVKALYASPEQAGKILVTSAEFKSLSDDPEAANLVELAKLSREEIAGAYAVPPPVLGILDRAIQSNVEGMREQFWRDVVGPWANQFEEAIMAQFVATTPSLAHHFVAFDMNEMLRPSWEKRAQIYEQSRHVFTPDEMRGVEGKAPLNIPESQTVWMPSGGIPLGLEQPQAETDEPEEGDEPEEQEEAA